MKGCRALIDQEIEAILAVLSRGRHPVRDRALFLLGLATGFRISELLSLRLSNVLQNGAVGRRLCVARRYMKGKKESREVILHSDIRVELEKLLMVLPTVGDAFLFQSQKGENRPMNRRSAWAMLKLAFNACGLDGKLATHSMRKTFALRCYEVANGNIRKVQEALIHQNLNSTAAYIPVGQDEVDSLVLGAWRGVRKPG